MTVATPELKEKLAELLSTLIDFEVDVYEASESNDDRVFRAYYCRGDVVESACVIDLSLANSLGAALPRIHPSMAADATKENSCPPNIRENLDEILNVCTCMLRLDQKQRIQLKQTFAPGEEIPTEFADATEGEKLAFRVEFGNYETGIFTLCFPKA